MTSLQNIVLILTAAISVISLGVGLLNFLLNVKNRRNSIREKVFEKQLEFFLELNGIMSEIMSQSHALWNPKIESTDEDITAFDENIDLLDDKVSKNSLIIPDELDSNFTVLINFVNEYLSDYYKGDSDFTEEKHEKITLTIIDINIDIEDYLAIDNLSNENMKISKGERIESRLALEKTKHAKS